MFSFYFNIVLTEHQQKFVNWVWFYVHYSLFFTCLKFKFSPVKYFYYGNQNTPTKTYWNVN